MEGRKTASFFLVFSLMQIPLAPYSPSPSTSTIIISFLPSPHLSLLERVLFEVSQTKFFFPSFLSSFLCKSIKEVFFHQVSTNWPGRYISPYKNYSEVSRKFVGLGKMWTETEMKAATGTGTIIQLSLSAFRTPINIHSINWERQLTSIVTECARILFKNI